ncbi:MAG: helix-turn-helix domain-containing protein [Clostridiales bacterium]|nr:helix-turn-helix domain-containing protein [Clostridiales bacterium]
MGLDLLLRRRQAVIKYAERYGVLAASRRYNVSRPTTYSWKKRYDGTLGSLKNFSRRPHHHPNEHTEAELKLICDIRRRNPNAGLVVLWVKLRQRGYSRSISGLLKVLKRTEQPRVKLMAVHFY